MGLGITLIAMPNKYAQVCLNGADKELYYQKNATLFHSELFIPPKSFSQCL